MSCWRGVCKFLRGGGYNTLQDQQAAGSGASESSDAKGLGTDPPPVPSAIDKQAAGKQAGTSKGTDTASGSKAEGIPPAVASKGIDTASGPSQVGQQTEAARQEQGGPAEEGMTAMASEQSEPNRGKSKGQRRGKGGKGKGKQGDRGGKGEQGDWQQWPEEQGGGGRPRRNNRNQNVPWVDSDSAWWVNPAQQPKGSEKGGGGNRRGGKGKMQQQSSFTQATAPVGAAGGIPAPR
mmetsp:Transcript_23773/g.55387  ORF Transcript_23773/g.55387 Transcript_23773/m.55387 type:complete len:235 (-) Transcript_23773:115-819(-)